MLRGPSRDPLLSNTPGTGDSTYRVRGTYLRSFDDLNGRSLPYNQLVGNQRKRHRDEDHAVI